jgi:hypothetical protein
VPSGHWGWLQMTFVSVAVFSPVAPIKLLY